METNWPCCRRWRVVDLPFLNPNPLDVAMLATGLAGAGRGAQVSFIGVVRNHHLGRGVTGLEYTAYGPMAERVCGVIQQEAEKRWPVSVALQHRTGALTVGEAAVAVIVAGDHREEAFAACRYIIEELKQRVPIWKREWYTDGTSSWVDPTQSARIESHSP